MKLELASEAVGRGYPATRAFQLVNNKIKDPVSIPDLVDHNGHECKNNIEKANALKEHFESVFIKEDISCGTFSCMEGRA